MQANFVLSSNCPEMKYFMDEDKSDVTFLVEGQRIPAIKALLSHKSEVFESMFSGNFVESVNNEVVIDDTTYDGFKSMIQFVYCEHNWHLNSWRLSNNYILAMDVYKCGHKYQMNGLIHFMEQILLKEIKLEFIEEICSFAILYKLEKLTELVINTIDKNIALFLNRSMDENKRLNSLTDNYLMEAIISAKNEEIQRLNKSVAKLGTELNGLNEEKQRIAKFFTTDFRSNRNLTIDGINYFRTPNNNNDSFIVSQKP